MAIFMIWPERRMVPDSLVEKWYLDAVDNGKISPEHFHAKTAAAQAAALEDAGLITTGTMPA